MCINMHVVVCHSWCYHVYVAMLMPMDAAGGLRCLCQVEVAYTSTQLKEPITALKKTPKFGEGSSA